MSFDTDIVNNSGKGPNYPVPDSVKNKFNWGAFLFSWIWGLGNHTFIVVVLFVIMWIISILINKLFGQNITIQVFFSLAGLLMCILFGIEGNRWAWQNKHFESVEAFHKYQKKWVVAWFLLVFVIGPIVAILLSAVIGTMMISPMIGH